MDYAIYKTNDGRAPRVIHRFTQQDCDHHAKRSARAKLDDMRYRTLQPQLPRHKRRLRV